MCDYVVYLCVRVFLVVCLQVKKAPPNDTEQKGATLRTVDFERFKYQVCICIYSCTCRCLNLHWYTRCVCVCVCVFVCKKITHVKTHTHTDFHSLHDICTDNDVRSNRQSFSVQSCRQACLRHGRTPQAKKRSWQEVSFQPLSFHHPFPDACFYACMHTHACIHANILSCNTYAYLSYICISMYKRS